MKRRPYAFCNWHLEHNEPLVRLWFGSLYCPFRILGRNDNCIKFSRNHVVYQQLYNINVSLLEISFLELFSDWQVVHCKIPSALKLHCWIALAEKVQCELKLHSIYLVIHFIRDEQTIPFNLCPITLKNSNLYNF